MPDAEIVKWLKSLGANYNKHETLRLLTVRASK